MSEVEIVILLLICAILLGKLAERIGVAYPILLVIGGIGIAFIPGLPKVELDPKLVFTLFLPPLLFSAAFFTPWDDFLANLRPIMLLAVGLVIATTVAVGYAAHWMIGIPLVAGFVLGAIVSPPDAIAATAVAGRLKLPRRVVSILEGESLVNDASGLVLFNLAVAAIVSGAFSWSGAAIDLITVSIGGIIIGIIVGYLLTVIARRNKDSELTVVMTLLSPFAAYLPAEHLGVSGVLATVAAGIYTGSNASRSFNPETRLRALHVWSIFVFLLNGLVFILIGLQLPTIIDAIEGYSPWFLAQSALVISLVVIGVRMAWVYPASYLPRLLVPGLRRHDPHPGWQRVTVIGWAGMRGIVSLAAALSLPALTNAGEPFPARPVILFLAFAVIVATLVLQGLSLPALIRILKVCEDGLEEQEREAKRLALEAALVRLEELALEGEIPLDAVELVQRRYLLTLRELDERDTTITPAVANRLRHEVISAERRLLMELRSRGVLPDEAFRRLEHELDMRTAGIG